MSLTDLKKGQVKPKKKKAQVSVDEFIDDALNYAQGKPQIVSAERATATDITKAKKKSIYRRATFTLNEQAFSQLEYLADKSDLAKSHILRILLDADPDPELKQQLMTLLAEK